MRFMIIVKATRDSEAGVMPEEKLLDVAIQLAARIPPARVGSIEVRPIRPIREMAGY